MRFPPSEERLANPYGASDYEKTTQFLFSGGPCEGELKTLPASASVWRVPQPPDETFYYEATYVIDPDHPQAMNFRGIGYGLVKI